jgi:uncharacterized tellurite resistance protein B-like protein
VAYLMGLLAAAAGVIWWMIRSRDTARDVADEAVDIVQTVANAPRRFGFRRRAMRHPVDDIDDGQVALGGLAVAFMQIGGTPTKEDRTRLLRAVQHQVHVDLDRAEELLVLGDWLVTQCDRPDAAFSRLARKLHHLDPEMLKKFVPLIKEVAAENGVTAGQQDELADLARRYRLA